MAPWWKASIRMTHEWEMFWSDRRRGQQSGGKPDIIGTRNSMQPTVWMKRKRKKRMHAVCVKSEWEEASPRSSFQRKR